MILKKPSGAAVGILFLLVAAAASPLQKEAEFSFPFSQFRLKNGLEAILSEDDSLPIVSVVMAYHVGSINEEPGKTGLAYLLENIMFMGSSNVGPMQHISHISRIGGEPNASTTEDITYFYQTVPSNQLALVLWLESDRLKALEIDAAKVERAKQAFLDEIRQRKAAEPFLESGLVFDRILYPDFARNHSLLGQENDIGNLRAEDVKNFYSSYYVPNNAVLVIMSPERGKWSKNILKGSLQSETSPPLPRLLRRREKRSHRSFRKCWRRRRRFISAIGSPLHTHNIITLWLLSTTSF
jgi:zinc protease